MQRGGNSKYSPFFFFESKFEAPGTEELANGCTINCSTLTVNSASRHVQGAGKAVDISRINGMKMSVFYSSDATIKAVVEAMQLEFEKYPHRRENFGPFLKKTGCYT